MWLGAVLAVEEEGGDIRDMVVLHVVCDGVLGDLWEGVCVCVCGRVCVCVSVKVCVCVEGYLRCERVRGDESYRRVRRPEDIFCGKLSEH